MVLREQTVIQVKSIVNQMENAMDLNRVKEVVGPAAGRKSSYSSPSRNSNRSSAGVERVNAVMANNLFHSVVKGRFRKIKLILDGGYKINSKNNYGYSILVGALHIDDDEKRDKMFRFLIDKGADPTEQDPKHQRSVLSWASLLGRLDQVNLVLKILNGDHDLAEKDIDGMTALHHATQGGHVDIVRRLVEEFHRFRLSVDVADNLGLTPYLHAKRLGYKEVTEVLLKEGRACPGQSDSFTFRSADEWSEIGQSIKQKELYKKRQSSYEHAAILGSSRLIREYYNPPSIPVIRVSEPKENDKTTYFVVKTEPPLRLKPQEPRGNFTAPAFSNSEPVMKGNSKVTFIATARSTPNPTLSLLSLTPGAKSLSPEMFKQSQPDNTKITHEKHNKHHGHGATIGSFMKVLSEQNTSSYRPTIVESPPQLDVPILRTKKDSTFASIFGKRKAPRSRAKKKRGSAKLATCRDKKVIKA